MLVTPPLLFQGFTVSIGLSNQLTKRRFPANATYLSIWWKQLETCKLGDSAHQPQPLAASSPSLVIPNSSQKRTTISRTALTSATEAPLFRAPFRCPFNLNVASSQAATSQGAGRIVLRIYLSHQHHQSKLNRLLLDSWPWILHLVGSIQRLKRNCFQQNLERWCCSEHSRTLIAR